MKKIAYYITAHGYGHGTRSCDVINALVQAEPHRAIIVKTDLPIGFLRNRIPDTIEIRPGAFDVGLIQKDSIRVDLDASIAALEKLYANEKNLIEQEKRFLQKENVGVVVADIPAIPLNAAQDLGIPTIACSNFGWDWIYSEFIELDTRWATYVDSFRTVYQKTDLLLRQPFAEPMAAFPRQVDLPLLAKPGTDKRNAITELTHADPSKKWVLLSFTSLNLSADALANIKQLDQYEFFSVGPLHWPDSSIRCISRENIRFADILASVDMVITKPGFGVVSECIANRKPIIYSDRKNFKEYPVLVKAIECYCTQAFIPNCDLYAGNFEQALFNVEAATPPKKTMERGGAELAAKHICAVID